MSIAQLLARSPRGLQTSLSTAMFLLIGSFALSGCEPQFTDGQCVVDNDCFPDERCALGSCRPAPQEIVLNECGGEEELENAVGDVCGPCNLDRYACDSTSLVCDGETPCPELDILTTNATSITATTALLNGRIDAFPLEPIDELGFCWSTSQEIGADDTCQALPSVPSQADSFSLPITELEPGTTYYAAAYTVIEGDFDVANVVSFQTNAITPSLNATAEEEGILLSWPLVQGAVGYELFANGELLAALEDDEVEYFDDTAPAGTLSAPGQVTASDGRSDGVRITWTAPVASPGAQVEYTLVAVFADADGDPSPAVSAGRLGPQVMGYEVQIGSGDPISLPLQTQYLDENAPLVQILPGPISVSKGEFENQVLLNSPTPASVAADQQSYRVRATYGSDATEYSSAVEGRRIRGNFTYQWERSSGDADENYSPITGATQRLFNYLDAPADGSIRYYRLQISAPGAEAATSDADFGFVATLGVLSGLSESTITANSVTLSATVDSLGQPAANLHGFCVSTSPEPVYPGVGSDICATLGVPGLGPFSEDLSDLSPNTTYYARGFLRSSIGTTYTGEVTFDTLPLLPPAPSNFSATSDQTGAIDLSWNAVPEAVQYEIYRGGELLIVLDGSGTTSYSDTTAVGPTLTVGTATATDGTIFQAVELGISAPLSSPGTVTTYEIRSVDALEQVSDFASTTGQRAAPDVEARWEYESDGDWVLLSSVDPLDPNYTDTTVPTDGSYRTYRFVALYPSLDFTVESGSVDGRPGLSILRESASFSKDDDDVTLTVEIEFPGTPLGTIYFCYGEEDFEFFDDDVATCNPAVTASAGVLTSSFSRSLFNDDQLYYFQIFTANQFGNAVDLFTDIVNEGSPE